MSDRDLRALLDEQIEFYRADAAAYDEWRAEVFEREGGGEFGARARGEQRRILRALDAFAPRGDVLELVEADLFRWQAPRRFDDVFFAYWMSHVPMDRFDAFWDRVDRALSADGRVFFVDSSGAGNSPGTPGEYTERDDPARQLSFRELGGRRYRVVKVTWQPEELESRLAELGWAATVQRGELAIWGTVVRQRT